MANAWGYDECLGLFSPSIVASVADSTGPSRDPWPPRMVAVPGDTWLPASKCAALAFAWLI